MTEEDFLAKFCEYCLQAPAYKPKELIQDFLANVHVKYKSVYWYKWEGREKEIAKEQVRFKLRDFIEHLELDEDSLDAKINSYVERILK